ncbi:MAG: Maf family protein [Pseudomonadales bacterium]
MSLVLGSTSPRRAELLRQVGLKFRTLKPAIDEQVAKGEMPSDYVSRMSNEKYSALIRVNELGPGEVLLTADTIVVYENEILGKPVDEADAARMLRKLSGKQHQVLTSVTIGQKDEHNHQFIVETNVHFRTLNDREIAAYWATGEPADKAGAYGIQGIGTIFVETIAGSYTNVVGLPLTETARFLADFNITIPDQPKAG